jgi:heme oxygenase
MTHSLDGGDLAHAGGTAGAVPLFDRLRRDTSELHAEVEGLLPLSAIAGSAPGYARFLALSWRFQHPLEQRLRQVSGLERVVPDLDRRQKAHLILRDLAALGAPAPTTGVGAPEITGVAQAIGCLYVLEGSTLGGQHIQRALLRQQPAAAGAVQFLTCYGPETGRLWKELRGHAERALPPVEHGRAVEAARASFAFVKLCFAGPWTTSWRRGGSRPSVTARRSRRCGRSPPGSRREATRCWPAPG